MIYEISELALEDIDSIWEYTTEKWSTEQAEKYYKEIFSAIEFICLNPDIGNSINEVKEHHRRKLIGSHMIIYKCQKKTVFIDRILHQRMDLETNLDT